MHTEPSEVAAIDRPSVSADTVLNLHEDTHETIADRLLGRLIALDPDTALTQLEAARAHLDERMVRSAFAPTPNLDRLRQLLAEQPSQAEIDAVLPPALAEQWAAVTDGLPELVDALSEATTDDGAPT